MQISPNGKLIAFFTQSGKLQVYSSDFQKQLLEFPAKSKVFPVQLSWYDIPIFSIPDRVLADGYVGAVMMLLRWRGKIFCSLLDLTVTGSSTAFSFLSAHIHEFLDIHWIHRPFCFLS